MKKALLLPLAAFLLVAYSAVAQADEECIFTSPDASSPLDVLDSAVYVNSVWGYTLWFPPASVLSYAAETNDEDEDDRTRCVLAAFTIYMKPYTLFPEYTGQTFFDIDITAYADWWTNWLPWPCPQRGWA